MEHIVPLARSGKFPVGNIFLFGVRFNRNKKGETAAEAA